MCRLVLLGVLLLAALASADNWSELAQFGSTFQGSTWTGVCTSSSCNIQPVTGDCDWLGVTADVACNVISFTPTPPGNLTPGQAYPRNLMKMTNITDFELVNYKLSDASSSLDWSAGAGINFTPASFFHNASIFRVESNNFNGQPFPTEFDSLDLLTTFSLKDSNFGGALPASWFSPAPLYLSTFDISGNQFDSLPAVLTQWVSTCILDTAVIDLSRNNFTGTLPFLPTSSSCSTTSVNMSRNGFDTLVSSSGLAFTSNLLSFDISHNLISRTLPTSYFVNFIKNLDMSHNDFNGGWPGFWVPNVATDINFSYNTLSGSIPSGSEGFADTQIVRLELQHNNFDGAFPDFPCISCSVSEHLDVSYNNLSGPIPSNSIKVNWNYGTMKVLIVNDNQLNGTIPSEVTTSSKYVVVDLSRNQFNGSLPDFSGSTNLTIFRASDNQFDSAFPAWVIGLALLDELNISNNLLMGVIPAGFVAWSAQLSACDISGNTALNYTECMGANCIGCPPAPTTAPPPTTPAPPASPTTAPPPGPSASPSPAPTTPAPSIICPSNDCGADPVAGTGLLSVCCAGTWTVFAPNNSAGVAQDITISSNSSILWVDPNDTLTIDFTGFLRKRIRQNQEALLKVDGDAFINGPLVADFPEDPAPTLVGTSIPVIQTINAGTLSGNFTSVTVNFPAGSCKRGSGSQSTTSTGLSVIFSVDDSGCGSKGLSGGQIAGIAIGATVGGILLILLIGILVLRTFFPRTAIKLKLKKSKSAVSAGSSFAPSRV